MALWPALKVAHFFLFFLLRTLPLSINQLREISPKLLRISCALFAQNDWLSPPEITIDWLVNPDFSLHAILLVLNKGYTGYRSPCYVYFSFASPKEVE